MAPLVPCSMRPIDGGWKTECLTPPNCWEPTMTDRRTILKASLLAPALFARPASAATGQTGITGIQMKLPCVVSTWDFGVAANQAAWAVLSKGGRLWTRSKPARGSPRPT